MAMTKPTLGLVVLRSSDIEALLTFYRAIGLSFMEEKHGSGPMHYSCQLGTTVIEIYPGAAPVPQDFRDSGATLLGFNVASLDAILDAMKLMNVPVLTVPKRSAWGRRAVVQDPDGRAVELNEPIQA
jgi:lactoylglutathione lyase